MSIEMIHSLSGEEFEKAIKEVPKLIAEVKAWAKKFLNDNYSLDLDIPINFRMSNGSNTMASISLDNKTSKPISITVNRVALISEVILSDEYLYKMLGHELIHYALNRLGRDYFDGDDDFENELVKHNFPSNHLVGTGEALNARYLKNTIEYVCKNTGELIEKRSINFVNNFKSKDINMYKNGEVREVNIIRKEVMIYG